jgi:hypothetical protein
VVSVTPAGNEEISSVECGFVIAVAREKYSGTGFEQINSLQPSGRRRNPAISKRNSPAWNAAFTRLHFVAHGLLPPEGGVLLCQFRLILARVDLPLEKRPRCCGGGGRLVCRRGLASRRPENNDGR